MKWSPAFKKWINNKLSCHLVDQIFNCLRDNRTLREEHASICISSMVELQLLHGHLQTNEIIAAKINF